MGNPRKILIIPHQPHRSIRVRALETAHRLAARGHLVHVLSWKLSPARSGLGRLVAKAADMVREAATPITCQPDETLHNLYWVTMPYLLAPNGICQWFNESSLKKLIRQHRFDVIINANAYHFPVPPSSALYVYDVVDDHLSEQPGHHWEITRAFTLKECGKARHVLAISRSLQDLLSVYGVSSPVLVANGVDVNACGSVAPKRLDALRQKHGLKADDFVLAYIGNHGPWSGLGFLLEVFKKISAQLPNAKLIIVGPGVEADQYGKDNKDSHVIFTGPVSPEEATAYFHLTKIGLLPFDVTPFTDHALPLKVFEYGAARKRVLASPLKELKMLNLPHVELLPLDANQWASTLLGEAQASGLWNPLWDDAIRAYDWQKVLAPLYALVEEDR